MVNFGQLVDKGQVMTQYEIYCDKCGGDVIDYVAPPKIEIERISMKDYAQRNNGPKAQHSVYYYTQHKLICTNCGNIEKYHV